MSVLWSLLLFVLADQCHVTLILRIVLSIDENYDAGSCSHGPGSLGLRQFYWLSAIGLALFMSSKYCSIVSKLKAGCFDNTGGFISFFCKHSSMVRLWEFCS